MTDTARRRAAIFWPAFIVFLLLVPIVAAGFLVAAATGDPSFAVESDYHAKALAWDQHREQEARNEALGWALEPRAQPAPGRPGELSLVVTLADAGGALLDGADVSVEGFQLARSGEVQRAKLRAVSPGVLAATLPSDRPGLWELRFDVTRGGDHFTHVSRVDVPARAPAP